MREDDSFKDGVRGEVHANEFGPAEGGCHHHSIGCCGTAGVEDPEAVFGIDDDELHADEVVLVVCSGWDAVSFLHRKGCSNDGTDLEER